MQFNLLLQVPFVFHICSYILYVIYIKENVGITISLEIHVKLVCVCVCVCS